MNIRFGSNEYALVPGSGINTLGNGIDIQLLAQDVNLNSLTDVLKNSANTETIKVVDGDTTTQVIEGYSKLDHMEIRYDQIYFTEYEEVIIVPAHHDSETGEEVPAQTEMVPQDLTADIVYIHMVKPGLEGQVKENTANIEFLAIMSDIEL